MNLITILRPMNMETAELIRARLESAGFHPVLADETAAASLGLAMATGGIRVQVPEIEADDAKKFLAVSDEVDDGGET